MASFEVEAKPGDEPPPPTLRSSGIHAAQKYQSKEEAAEALKLTADDLKANGMIDRIVPEPFGGAHRSYDEAAANLKRQVNEALAEVRSLSEEDLISQRIAKFSAMGVWET